MNTCGSIPVELIASLTNVPDEFLPGGIFHDPDLFDDPETFEPERFLRSEYGTKPGVDDQDFRHTFLFGAGRVSVLPIFS